MPLRFYKYINIYIYHLQRIDGASLPLVLVYHGRPLITSKIKTHPPKLGNRRFRRQSLKQIRFFPVGEKLTVTTHLSSLELVRRNRVSSGNQHSSLQRTWDHPCLEGSHNLSRHPRFLLRNGNLFQWLGWRPWVPTALFSSVFRWTCFLFFREKQTLAASK